MGIPPKAPNGVVSSLAAIPFGSLLLVIILWIASVLALLGVSAVALVSTSALRFSSESSVKSSDKTTRGPVESQDQPHLSYMVVPVEP